MLNLIIATVLIAILIILKLVLKINFKELKKLEQNEELNKITNKFPENIEVCRTILKKIKNENVKIEENVESKTSLYIAITNKIIIANLKNSYARIQTIAHECVHSVQNRNILLFNFIFSNIYLMYFAISIILTILGVFENFLLQIIILLILSFIYFMVRSYLETEAMVRAEAIAKEYIEGSNVCTTKEKEELINEYNKINKVSVISYNYILFGSCIIKLIIYCLISGIISYI